MFVLAVDVSDAYRPVLYVMLAELITITPGTIDAKSVFLECISLLILRSIALSQYLKAKSQKSANIKT